MYAHKVIEALKQYGYFWSPKRTPTLYPKKKNQLGFIEYLLDLFNQCQCFHLGDATAIYNSHRINVRELERKWPDGYYKWGEDFNRKLPYPVTWWDYWLQEDQELFFRGSLVEERKNENSIRIFSFAQEKIWFTFFPFTEIDIASGGMKLRTIQKNQIFKRTQIKNEELLEVPEIFSVRNASVIEQALKILNCKNITTIRINPNKRLNRKRKGNNKLPLFSYYELVVKGKGKFTGKSIEGDGHNRVHLCRGHFKTYTPEKPLLGKAVGMYWWQPHIRGQNRNGVVMKDYEIKPGGE